MKLRLSLISIVCLTFVAIAYQNCGEEAGKGEGVNHTVSTLCHPSGSCLQFRLLSWGKMDCDSGQNKVQIQTLSVQNASVMTDVSWTGCDKVDANTACCDQGDVSGRFSTSSGARDITIYFNNDVDYQYDYSQ